MTDDTLPVLCAVCWCAEKLTPGPYYLAGNSLCAVHLEAMEDALSERWDAIAARLEDA